jgi:hypothetical protein
MTREMVFKEFRDFSLTETEVDKIVNFYRSGADLLAAMIGTRFLNDDLPLKLSLNSIKYVVILMMELKNDTEKQRSS